MTGSSKILDFKSCVPRASWSSCLGPQMALGTRVLANIESGSSHIRQVSSTHCRNVIRYYDLCRSKWVGARTGTYLVRKSED